MGTRTTRRGFSLVEVSIVVVVVAILGAIGTVGYLRYRRSVRMTEATSLVSMIKSEQEAYKTERGVYAIVSSDVESFYPAPFPGAFSTAWGGPCTTCVEASAWEKLSVKPAGPVMYGYATVSGVGEDLKSSSSSSGSSGPSVMTFIPAPPDDGTSASSSGGAAAASCATIKPTEPFFVIKAKGDVDGDGIASTVLALSCSTSFILTNEGE